MNRCTANIVRQFLLFATYSTFLARLFTHFTLIVETYLVDLDNHFSTTPYPVLLVDDGSYCKGISFQKVE